MQNNIKTQTDKSREWAYAGIAEIAFFLFLYYVQRLLKIEGNLWISSLVLWLLLNIAIGLCPLLRRCSR